MKINNFKHFFLLEQSFKKNLLDLKKADIDVSKNAAYLVEAKTLYYSLGFKRDVDTDSHRESERERETERQTDRQTERERERVKCLLLL